MRRAFVLVLLLTFAGCGSSSPPEAEPVLPTAALPGLEATTQPLTAEDLAADSGTERVFQGESHDLTRVVSRTVEFETPEAAHSYVDLLRAHVDDLYGAGTTAEPLEEGGRSGYVIDPAAC